MRPEVTEAYDSLKPLVATQPIETTKSLREIDLYHGNIQEWLSDPRFEHLVAEMGTRKKGRRLKSQSLSLSETSDTLQKPKVKRIRVKKRSVDGRAERVQKHEKYSDHQRQALLKAFEIDENPGEEHRRELAKDLGISMERINTWFYMRRAKLKAGISH